MNYLFAFEPSFLLFTSAINSGCERSREAQIHIFVHVLHHKFLNQWFLHFVNTNI